MKKTILKMFNLCLTQSKTKKLPISRKPCLYWCGPYWIRTSDSNLL